MPERFSQVDEHLLRGSVPEVGELPILRDVWGVRKIISLDEQSGKNIERACKKLGINQEIIPLTDGHDKGFNVIPSKVFEWEADGPVFVHCKHGKDRTSAVCAIYRVLVNGWTVGEALAEAFKFGMGKGLSKDTRDSYYQVVRRCVKEGDKNNADVVSLHRGLIEDRQPKPIPGMVNPVSSAYTSDSSPLLGGPSSFSPFSDVEVDHLNRPAEIRIQELVKLAVKKIYRVCRPHEVQIYNSFWETSPQAAIKAGSGQSNDAVLISAELPDDINLIKYINEPDKTMIRAAVIKEADAVWFCPPVGFDKYFIIDPSVLVNIKMIGNDTNDAPLVGLHDNYDGFANMVFPGGGTGMVPGLAGGAGGFAGFVQVPGQQF